MMPRLKIGKGVTGCIRYVFGEGRDPKTGELLPHPLDGSTRVAWFGGTGFGFDIDSRDDADLARRVMEFDALNQASKTRKCEQDCVHLSLAWARGETPSREDMEATAHEALEAIGMKNAKALFVAHGDEDFPHVHIIASKINPDTGRAYDLEKSYRKLSKWALEFEREHGGVHLKGREDMNELRDAIARRDAGGVLEAMTRQRATFTGKELERALQKEIYAPRGADAGEKRSVELARAQFADKILDHANCVHLSKEPGGATTRYTTRSVLEAEGYVMRAAEGLAANKTHGLTGEQRFATLNGAQHAGISREQAHAFGHATGEEGLAIIDGLAGAGKSRTTNAVREAYEAAGYRVIGTAWTHKVVQDMEAKGFENTSTVKRELFMLANGRRQWDSKTVVIIDEAAMLDTAHMAMMTSYANEAGAKLILVGDDRQLASIERGGMFGVLKDRFGAATLTEINRQISGDDRRASEYFAEGKFHDALGIYQQKDGIHWTRTQGQARAELLDTYRRDVEAAPNKSRFIFAYTNIDCAELNKGAREVHRQLGQLGEDHQLDSADGRLAFAAGDRIQFLKTDKKLGLYNGSVGTVKHIENGRVFAEIDGKVIGFDSAQYQSFRHGYAGTIYKGQGATVDQSYLYHSEHWRSAASYVGMTRHREKAELFAATNTAENIDQLARQMSRVDEGKRYAASMYHHRQQIDPVRPLSAAEVMAKFADKGFEREQQQQAQEYRRPRVIEQTAAEMRGARRARPLNRQHRQQRQQQGTGKMDNELDEEEQRRRHRNAGVGVLIDIEPKPQQQGRTANQNEREPPPAEEIDRLQQPFTEREERPFQPSEQQPGRYDEIRDKAKLAEDILAQQGDMHSHYDIGPWEGGVAVFRTYEIDDNMLAEYGLPTGQQIFGRADTLDQLHEAIIDGSALTTYPQWVTDERIEREALRAERGTKETEISDPTPREAGDADLVLQAVEAAVEAKKSDPREPITRDADADLLLQVVQAEREARKTEAREPMTIEAIERNPWNAVALDLPADADRQLAFLVANTARELRHALAERGNAATTPEQQELWFDLAGLAKESQKDAEMQILVLDAALQPVAEYKNEPQPGRDAEFIFDKDFILQAVEAELETRKSDHREPITRDADADLVLQAVEAELAAKKTETREPTTREASDADLVLQAVEAELEARKSEAPKSMTLDDIAERVQAIIDNPDLAGEEHNDMILRAVQARLEGDEFTRPASQDYEPAPAQAEQQSDHTRSRTAADEIAGMSRGEDDAGEQEQERGDDGEDEPTLEQGGGGLERSR